MATQGRICPFVWLGGTDMAWLYRQREPVALGTSIALLMAAVLLWQLSPGLSQALAPPPPETVVQLDDAPPEPQPAKPPSLIRPPAPLPDPAPQSPVVRTPLVQTAPQPMAQPAAAHPDAVPAPPPPVPVANAVQAALQAPPQPIPAPPPALDHTAQVLQANANYVGQLRAYLNSIKRYPNSREARQLRPTGVVKAWLELDRAGQVLDAGIEASAGTALLDNEALRTLRTGRYPAFPAEAFAGEARHRFLVPLEYLVDGG